MKLQLQLSPDFNNYSFWHHKLSTIRLGVIYSIIQNTQPQEIDELSYLLYHFKTPKTHGHKFKNLVLFLVN